MNFKILGSLLLVLTLLTSITAKSDIIEIVDNNFKSATKQFKNIFLFFYTEKCHYCDLVNDQFDKLVNILKQKGPQVKLVKINADDNLSVRDDFKVTKVPVLFLIKNDQIIQYIQPQTTQLMHDFLHLNLKQHLDYLTQEDYNNLEQKHDVAIIYHGNKTDPVAMRLKQISQKDPLTKYFYIDTTDKPRATIQMVRDFDENIIFDYKSQVEQWIKLHDTPLHKNAASKRSLNKLGKGVVAIFYFTPKQLQQRSQIFEQCTIQLNNKYPSQFIFIQFSGQQQKLFELTLKNFNFNYYFHPVLIYDGKQQKKYAIQIGKESELSVQSIMKGIEAYKAGQLKAHKLTQRVVNILDKQDQQKKKKREQKQKELDDEL